MLLLPLADMLTGAVMGGVAGVLIAGVAYIVADQMQRKGSGLGQVSTVKLFWPGDYLTGAQAAKQALQRAGGSFLSEDESTRLIIGRVKGDLTTFGVSVRIQFSTGESPLAVTVSAQPTIGSNAKDRAAQMISAFQQHWFAQGGTSAEAPPK